LVLFAVSLFARYWSVLSACACTAALKVRSLGLHTPVCVASRCRYFIANHRPCAVPPDQRLLPV